MAARSQTSSKKRQKELARQEKQKEKVARRAQRKLEKLLPDAEPSPDAELGADGQPVPGVEPAPDAGVVAE